MTTNPAPRSRNATPAPPQPTALPADLLPSELMPFRAHSGDEERHLLAQGLVRRVIADVLVASDAPDSREVRAAATGLLIPIQTRVDPGWVVGFASAAWLHTGSGLPGRPGEEELQVIIPPGRRRPRVKGVRGRQVALEPDQVLFLDGLAVTSPVRTAADVARDLPADEALEALRRLGELTGVRPHQVITMLSTMRYARGAATARVLVNQWAVQG